MKHTAYSQYIFMNYNPTQDPAGLRCQIARKSKTPKYRKAD